MGVARFFKVVTCRISRGSANGESPRPRPASPLVRTAELAFCRVSVASTCVQDDAVLAGLPEFVDHPPGEGEEVRVFGIQGNIAEKMAALGTRLIRERLQSNDDMNRKYSLNKRLFKCMLQHFRG